MMATDCPTLMAALGYAARGWDVFPAPPGEKKSCKSAEYSNGAKWGKTRDPEQIRRDFQRWPNANVGIPTGADAGFWVVELDTPKGHAVDGIASLRLLEEKHGELPPTLMAASPSGSLHHYFKWPDAVVIKNSASGIGPGIDVRGEGGMVIAPPSVRGDGEYRWLNDNPIADAPQWLIDRAVAASKSNGKGGGGAAEEPQASIERIRAAFAVIPNENRGWDDWNRCGLALYHATAGSDDGLAVFHAWSRKSKKYDAQATDDRWAHHKTCPPTEIGAGSIFHWADEASPGWEMLVGMPLGKAMKIAKLVTLSTFEYENERKAVAEEMGMRTGVLDDMVDRLRPRGAKVDDDGKQGHAISFPEPEPWPESINGAELLNEVAVAIRRHVVLPDHSRDAAALWVVHTYLLDRLMITPRLGVRSPVKGCGKTTLLDVVSQLVHRPLPAANCSASSIFRVVEGYRPCLLIDEADSFLSDNEELRGVLNSGHRRGGAVLRCVGDAFEPRSFSTYGACVIALIGQLPATLADRSVTIDLTRRKPDEAIEPFRFDRVESLNVLARKLVRWAKDNEEAVAEVDPEMPVGLYNRSGDNWRPLLAIATVAGGDWLSRGHKAALAGSGADVDEGSRLERLLGDIRDIFDGLKVDRISSAEMIERLVEITPRPWAEYGRSGKPITQNKLARLLKPLSIAAQVIRVGDKTPRGYTRNDFEEAWERFLPPTGGFKPQHRNKVDEIRTSDAFQTATPDTDVALRKNEKPNNDGLCCGVALSRGENGKEAHPPLGDEPGLSRRRIEELARWYIERADSQHQEAGDVDSAVLDAGLRQVLAEQVLPEHVEVEFRRVMTEVFRSRKNQMGKRSTFPRNPLDFYATPAAAVPPLVPHLRGVRSFVEPCCGDGALVRHLESHGLHCAYAGDIATGQDALTITDYGKADSIITNPPYARPLMHALIAHFMRILPTWLLIESDWAHTKQAAPFMPSCSNIVSVGRLRWIEGTKMSSMENFGWYHFNAHHVVGPIFHARDSAPMPSRVSLCAQCGKAYRPQRSDSKHCSGGCRQRAYRERLNRNASVTQEESRQ